MINHWLLLFFFYQLDIFSLENKILFIIYNKIIYSFDIYNEITYLKFINSIIEKLVKYKIFGMSTNY